MSAEVIRDPDDERVAPFRDLTDAQWRRRVEAEQGFFVAEGHRVIDQVLRRGLRVHSILLSQSRAATFRPDVDAPMYVATQNVIDEIAGFHAHRGALAIVERPRSRATGDVVGCGGHLLLVEDVADHENLGALFRNAAAFGMGGVVLSPRCCDPLYRRTVRVSMGHVLSVPWATANEWPLKDLDGLPVVALTPDESAIALDAANLAQHERVALLVGAEGPGLTAAARAAATIEVRIPMALDVDSINVATAAAIAMSRLRD